MGGRGPQSVLTPAREQAMREKERRDADHASTEAVETDTTPDAG
jgi:hypothetical protein